MLESTLYEAGIRLYAGAVAIASAGHRKAALMRAGHKEIWHTLAEKLQPGRAYIWLHAASLGEFEQGRPVIERIRRQSPETGIVLTFFSPSGYEVRKNYAGADVVCYLPFDTRGNARRFIETVKPRAAIFVKYEIWRNYLHELRAHNIPTFLISAVFRPEQLFFKKRGGFYRNWLKLYDRIYVQDEASRKLLEGVGIRDAEVAGDTRFDRVTDVKNAAKKIPELEAFRSGAKLMVMIGSSWEADEDVYSSWFDSHPDVKLVVAPHEFDAARLEKLRQRFKGGVVLLSEIRAEGMSAMEGKQVLVIDCFGLLSSAYAYADIAYVGGAFGAGLHNVNEAAVYGIPVIFGPRYSKFIEARELIECSGGISVKDSSELNHALDTLLTSPEELHRRGEAAGKYIRSKVGASDKVWESICNFDAGVLTLQSISK